MNKLESYIQSLDNSAPIFHLRLQEGGNRITRSVAKQYRPTPVPGDFISYLVSRHFQESFMNGAFRKNTREIQRAVIDDIHRAFRQLIENYGGFKNARQSLLYRFIARSSSNLIDEHVDGLIMLYAYARKNGMDEMHRMPEGVHRDNVLGILEAMRVKYVKD